MTIAQMPASTREEIFRNEDTLGRDVAAELVRTVSLGAPDVATVLAGLSLVVESRRERNEDGSPRLVPLGKVLFLDAGGDWSGEFPLRGPDALAIAESYAGGDP